MASTARIDELKKKFDENPRRYFAPLANEFRKAGDIDQAILICEEFLPQQPGHMSGHIVYGQALYEAGKLPESRTVFETALALDPENLIALRHLGDIARGQADHAAARNWYVRVLDADPRNEEIQGLIATLDREIPSVEAESVVEASAPAAPAFSLGLEIEQEIAPFEAPIPPPVQSVQSADPSLADTSPLGVPVIPPIPRAPTSTAGADLLEGFSLHGFETPPESGMGIHDDSAPAFGLESTAFTPPEEPISETAELDESLDSGVPSFSAPADRIESLAGLEGSGGIAHADSDTSGHRTEREEFAPLDLDDGLALPPQGDPLGAEAFAADEPEPHAREATTDEPAPVDFDMASAESVSETQHAPSPELDDDVAVATEEVAETAPVARAPFVTETMAELYLAQGFPEQALSVYQHLLDASPDDTRLSGLVASLTPSAAVVETGPTVREFFARMAGRRPGSRSAASAFPADDDFAPQDETPETTAVPEEAPYSVVEADAEVQAEFAPPDEPDPFVASEAVAPEAVAPEAVAPAIERAAAMRTPSGSIDALFGNQSPGTSEDSAAAALAQAFGGEPALPPVIAGRPARAASGELSLDSVFRDGPARPPRASQSFSFDQFFTGASERNSGPTPLQTSTELAQPGDAPAERSADDIEQFNSWLQGLKQR